MVDTPALNDHVVPIRKAGAVQAEVDGETILLSPVDFSYFGAAGSGAPIWDLIDGQRSLGSIIAELEAGYEAPEGAIRLETVQFIEALEAAGLLEPLR